MQRHVSEHPHRDLQGVHWNIEQLPGSDDAGSIHGRIEVHHLDFHNLHLLDVLIDFENDIEVNVKYLHQGHYFQVDFGDDVPHHDDDKEDQGLGQKGPESDIHPPVLPLGIA